MPKLCMNYDSGKYEEIDEDGFSYSQGDYVDNWDDSPYHPERKKDADKKDADQ